MVSRLLVPWLWHHAWLLHTWWSSHIHTWLTHWLELTLSWELSLNLAWRHSILLHWFDSSPSTILTKINLANTTMITATEPVDNLLTVVTCSSVIGVWVSLHICKDMSSVAQCSTWRISSWCIYLGWWTVIFMNSGCSLLNNLLFINIVIT